MSLYVPRLRIPLESWCEWTDNPWGKISKIVGRSFRMPARHENAYTMAAEAALRLIRQYDVDPNRIGQLALGTESSSDNAAGAVIVRGLLDQALTKLGLPRIARDCEVPEFKHACLGGVYALKSACRYVGSDGDGRVAIVISSDIAEYARGSSGEQTQGAGAVAMLVERDPKLFAVDLDHAGSTSAYRGPDFRKPFARHFEKAFETPGRDYPVFSGRYSTYAYLDEIAQAFDAMLERMKISASDFLETTKAAFFHRPYHYMPIQGLSFLYVRALAGSKHAEELLGECCQNAEVSLADIQAEVEKEPDLYSDLTTAGQPVDGHPKTTAVAGFVRKQPWFRERVKTLMDFGGDFVKELGNLYTAALPAWIAAGFSDAASNHIQLAGTPLLALGYGSGDAAESIPLHAVSGWEKAATRLGISDALNNSPVDLTQAQYEALHDGLVIAEPLVEPNGFAISHIGREYGTEFQDLSIEYYNYNVS